LIFLLYIHMKSDFFMVPYSREENEVKRWGSRLQILLDRKGKISQCGSSATCRKMTTAA